MQPLPPDPAVRQTVRRRLLPWYDCHHRALPWRQTRDPYAITVSEFMCQQTQVATVIPYYHRWLERFPDWSALANVPITDVLKVWEGLGYYRRARHLHQLARTVVDKFNGHLPAHADQLRELPGIGPYMAGAIASIAFNQVVPLVDGNVERVLARLHRFTGQVRTSSARRQFWAWAEALVHPQRPGDHNQALMELGATLCTPRQPKCLLCPLSSCCTGRDQPEHYPQIPRPAAITLTQTYAVVVHRRRIWLLHPETPGRWQGLHRLPLLDPTWMIQIAQHTPTTLTITRYRIRAVPVSASPRPQRTPPATGGWHPLTRLATLTLPAPHRRIIQSVLANF